MSGRPSQELIEAALARWGLAQAEAKLAAERENQVFCVTSGAERFALRFHRPGYRSTPELESELAWTRALAAGGLSVANAHPSGSGRLIEELGGWQVDLLTWLDGAPMGQSNQFLDRPDKPLIYERLGQAMARLHTISDAWQPPAGFQRWSWDRDGLLGEAPLWGRFWDNPALDRADRNLMLRFRARAQADLQAQASDLDFGLIHADLVRENVMVAGVGDSLALSMIDFDDGGFGYRLFDIATALLKIQAEPDYAASKAALLQGYRGQRPLNTGPLALFMALRAATYVGWIVPRLAEAGAQERQTRFITAARTAVLDYLQTAN